MRSTFFGLEVARSAIQANQVALNTVGHNIANASTKGYSRQEAVMSPTRPYTTPGMNRPTGAGQIGTGVQVAQIRRLRDTFIDTQIRKESQALGEWEAKQKSLEQMELIYNEPSDTAIRAQMDEFWQALQDLSVKPELEPVRTTVRQKALTLTDTLNHTSAQLEALRRDNDAEIDIKVTEINSLIRQISDINREVVQVEVSGNNANDYRDRRDLLLDSLAKLVNIQVEEDQYGAANIFVGGKALVFGNTYSELKVELEPGSNFRQVRWADTGASVVVNGGALKGLIDLRDTVIPESIAKLDQITTTLAVQINSLHKQGVSLDGLSGLNFFASKEPDNAWIYQTAGDVFKDTGTDLVKDGNYTFQIQVGGDVTYSFTMTIDSTVQKTNKDVLQLMAAQINGASDLQAKIVTDTNTGTSRLEMTSIKGITGFIDSDGNPPDSSDPKGILALTGAHNRAITARDICVSQDIMTSLRNIAAASKFAGWTPGTPPPSGDGSNALAMADIKQTKLAIGAAVTTLGDYFNSAMAELGVLALEADSRVTNKEALIDGLETRRQSVCGVNPDDEMANMIKFQHGYSAAARFITTYNELLETIINRMGV